MLKLRKPSFRINSSYDVAFSPSGSHLAVVGTRLFLYDVSKRRKIDDATTPAHTGLVDFSPTGDRIVVKSTTGEIESLGFPDLTDRRAVHAPDEVSATPILFTSDGKRLIDTWSSYLTVRDSRTGEILHRHDFEIRFGSGFAYDLCCSLDRGTFACLRVPPTATGQAPCGLVWQGEVPGERTCRISGFPHDARNPAIGLSPDGSEIAMAFDDTLRITECESGRERCRTTLGPSDGIHSGLIRWAPDGSGIVVVTRGAVVVLGAETLDERARFGPNVCYDVAYAPEGEYLACAGGHQGMVLHRDALDPLIAAGPEAPP